MMRHYFLLLIRLIIELMVLTAFFVVSRQLVIWLHIPIPPAVIGLVLLLSSFALGWLKPEQLQMGTAFLLAEMLLFFIPALMSLLDYGALLKGSGWKILLTIVLSTSLVMVCSALTVEFVYRWILMRRWRKRHHGH